MEFQNFPPRYTSLAIILSTYQIGRHEFKNWGSIDPLHCRSFSQKSKHVSSTVRRTSYNLLPVKTLVRHISQNLGVLKNLFLSKISFSVYLYSAKLDLNFDILIRSKVNGTLSKYNCNCWVYIFWYFPFAQNKPRNKVFPWFCTVLQIKGPSYFSPLQIFSFSITFKNLDLVFAHVDSFIPFGITFVFWTSYFMMWIFFPQRKATLD